MWRNETEGGAIRHNVTFSRIYKPEGEQWHSSTSFGRDDLLLLGKLADRATRDTIGALEGGEFPFREASGSGRCLARDLAGLASFLNNVPRMIFK